MKGLRSEFSEACVWGQLRWLGRSVDVKSIGFYGTISFIWRNVGNLFRSKLAALIKMSVNLAEQFRMSASL
jgi:hypothetical protein